MTDFADDWAELGFEVSDVAFAGSELVPVQVAVPCFTCSRACSPGEERRASNGSRSRWYCEGCWAQQETVYRHVLRIAGEGKPYQQAASELEATSLGGYAAAQTWLSEVLWIGYAEVYRERHGVECIRVTDRGREWLRAQEADGLE